ncbi:MAG: hypothetical protein WA383_20160 [Terriglobales bacterium]
MSGVFKVLPFAELTQDAKPKPYPRRAAVTVPGSLSNCSGNTQSTIEGTFGFWLRLYHGPKGRLQLGPQYSYLVRNAWPGSISSAGTGPYVAPHGIDNMFMTSFRYYLP